MSEITLNQITFTQEDSDIVFNLAPYKKGRIVCSRIAKEDFSVYQGMCQRLIDDVALTNQVLCVCIIGDSSFKIKICSTHEIENHYAQANADQLALLLVFFYYFTDLKNPLAHQWFESLKKEPDMDKRYQMFACLEKYHREIIPYMIRESKELTPIQKNSVAGRVLHELKELMDITESRLYVDYGIPDYFVLEEHTEHSIKQARKENVRIERLAELYHVVTEYRPEFRLPGLLFYKWIDACIQMLDNTQKNSERKKFYQLLEKWCYQTPLNVLQWLFMKYRNEPDVIQELMIHVPHNITRSEKNAIKELIDLLGEDFPKYDSQYDNLLVKYFWLQREKINKASSEKSLFFNLLKEDYPELMSKLTFITVAARYEELGQTHNIFDKKHHFTHLANDKDGMELLIDFSTVHEMLLLKNSTIIEIQEWFHKKIFIYLQGSDFMSAWGMRYLSYEKTTSNNGFINLLWKNEPRFTQDMLKKSLCDLFWQIRRENPDKIEDVVINPAKWFNACWLRLRLASLEEEGSSENQDTGSEGYIKI